MQFVYLIFFVVMFNTYRESVSLPVTGSTGFKLPKPLTSGTAITINGTMTIKDNSLTVALSEKGGKHLCDFNYDASANMISVKQSKDKNLSYDLKKMITPARFLLHIEPLGSSITFELDVNGEGPQLITCSSGNFETVNRIIVKGAESVSSLLFQY